MGSIIYSLTNYKTPHYGIKSEQPAYWPLSVLFAYIACTPIISINQDSGALLHEPNNSNR